MKSLNANATDSKIAESKDCADYIIAAAHDDNSARSLFNLLVAIGANPAARRQTMDHIRNNYMS